jgi:hypothetical protein
MAYLFRYKLILPKGIINIHYFFIPLMFRQLRTSYIIVVVIMAILASTNSCKHEVFLPETPPSDTLVSENCSVDTVYFGNEIFPLITSTCAKAGCHDAISHEEGVNLTTYDNIMKYVKPGNPGDSKIYEVITKSGEEKMPPPPNTAWTTLQINRLKTWIEQGAKNNVCNSCDSTNYKYSTAIRPLIQTSCLGCHSGTSPGGGIDLSTYTGVKTIGLNGKFYGTITWSPGFSAMPKGIKLTDCKIGQVKKWIDAGCPNN